MNPAAIAPLTFVTTLAQIWSWEPFARLCSQAFPTLTPVKQLQVVPPGCDSVLWFASMCCYTCVIVL